MILDMTEPAADGPRDAGLLHARAALALLVVGVVMVARALLEAEDGLGQDPAR